MTQRCTAWAVSLLLFLPASVAHGEEPSNPTAPIKANTAPAGNSSAKPLQRESSPVDRPELGAHRLGPFLNSGLYLRMGLGFGATNDLVGTSSTDDEDGNRSTVTGIGAVGEVLIGAAMTPEVVFGGGLWLSSMSSASYFYDRGAVLPETMQKPRDFAMVGPFVDWYFARRPGLHVQGGLGFALLTGSGWARGNDDGNPGFGGGLSAAFGYDSWVSDTWKLGVLARVTSAVLAERSAGETWIHTTTGFPALLLSATYN